jgi:hypothetical protein
MKLLRSRAPQGAIPHARLHPDGSRERLAGDLPAGRVSGLRPSGEEPLHRRQLPPRAIQVTPLV